MENLNQRLKEILEREGFKIIKIKKAKINSYETKKGKYYYVKTQISKELVNFIGENQDVILVVLLKS